MVESPVLDLSARLLANENINVVRSNARTASFDLQSRTLTLPQWKEITPEVDQMLVAHEVSHALFTPQLYSTAIKTDSRLQFKQSHDYVNIIEDARVERLMKNRYPGIRKTFFVGYKQLNDLDFFGVQDTSLENLCLIDRINLYYKAGFNCGVRFSESEMAFVRRIDDIEDFDDVIVLAREIYDFDVNQHKKLPQETDTSPSEEEGGEDQGDDDGDHEDLYEDDSDVSSEGSKEGSSSRGNEDNPEPKVTTAKKFSERLNSLADTNTVYRYYTLGSMAYDPVVPFKSILTRANRAKGLGTNLEERERQAARAFKQKNQNNVDYLVKEFEMKKAATAYKRTQVSKSGSLNPNRLWAYKLSDDVFKRIQTVEKEKNHGMIFLLDWSGSMARVIDDTLDQVINLAMFCQRTGIKYRVYTFAMGDVLVNLPEGEAAKYRNMLPGAYSQGPNRVINPSSGDFMMMELFSDRMSLSEFTDMVSYIQGQRILKDFRLSGTPLNHALIHVYNTLDKFKRDNGIEKMSFITLTDGEGSKLVEIKDEYHKEVHHFIRDTHTKSTHRVTPQSYTSTRALLKMIKERHGCTTLGFYITPPNDARNVIRDHYGSLTKAPKNILDSMKSQIRKQGYASLPDTGRDELFVVPASKVQISYYSLEITEEDTVRSIASSFNKFLNKQKTSRFLLDKFITHIA